MRVAEPAPLERGRCAKGKNGGKLFGHDPHGAQLVRIFVDRQLKVPVRYEQYDWPGIAGDKPELAEHHSYLDLEVNQGFTDLDFDVKNPNYHFP